MPDLFHQLLVDTYAKVEGERLLFIRYNQKQLRAETYIYLCNAITNDEDIHNVGQPVILPSTIPRGPLYMHERMQDAMTYVRTHGKLDLFVTFTCNPQWDEIKAQLLLGQRPHNRHDLEARVFRRMLQKMVDLITMHLMYTIEWQKQGQPHAHMLIWLLNKIHPNQIDSIIRAELTDTKQDPELFEVIKSQMVHGPCGP